MPAQLNGAAAEYVAKRYYGGMGEREKTESIGTTSSEVIGNDPERVSILLVNLSGNTMYIGLEAGVSSTNGILLAANGGSYQVDVEEDLLFPIRAHHAIAAGASSTLYVLTARREFSYSREELVNANQ